MYVMALYNIMAIVVNYRSKKAGEIQSIFTKYGCLIKVRLGLHEAGNICSEDGLIILQLEGEKTQIVDFQNELNSVMGVKANIMEI
jgi:metal-responsive CopG/Arc/MetJ family transcriptional regulator